MFFCVIQSKSWSFTFIVEGYLIFLLFILKCSFLSVVITQSFVGNNISRWHDINLCPSQMHIWEYEPEHTCVQEFHPSELCSPSSTLPRSLKIIISLLFFFTRNMFEYQTNLHKINIIKMKLIFENINCSEIGNNFFKT